MFEKDNKFGKGRILGSKNVITQDIKNRLQLLVQDNMSALQDDLDSLEPKDRVSAIINLINYTTPKLKSVEATVTSVTDMSPHKIERLERMSELIEGIKTDRGYNSTIVNDSNTNIDE